MTQENTPKSPFKTYITRAVWILVLAGGGWLVSYSLQQVNLADAEEEILVCDDNGDCIKTTHIHADIQFDLCGKSTVLQRETGDLAGVHTHKEANYLHFHDKLDLEPKGDHAVAPTPGEEFHFDEHFNQLRDERLSVQMLLDTYDLDPMKFCGTDNIDIEVDVNGQLNEDGLTYNRSDGDEIVLRYKKR